MKHGGPNSEPGQRARSDDGVLDRSPPRCEALESECDFARGSSLPQDGALAARSRDGPANLVLVKHGGSFAAAAPAHQLAEQGGQARGSGLGGGTCLKHSQSLEMCRRSESAENSSIV